MAEALKLSTSEKTIVLVGQPNVGKSLIFSRLTGHYVTCSNYPGTTVEIYRGNAQLSPGAESGRDEVWHVLDTPGVMSLTASSEAESATRELLLSGAADAVLQVADAKNPERALAMTVQLAELGLPLLLDLNMADERRRLGLRDTVIELSQPLGIPVVETVATTGEGVEALREAIGQARASPLRVEYGAALEPAIQRVESAIEESLPGTLGGEMTVQIGPSCSGACGGSVRPQRRCRIRPRGLATLMLGLPSRDATALLGALGVAQEHQKETVRRLDEVRSQYTNIAYEMALARRRTADTLLRESPETPPGASADGGVPHVASPGWGERLASWTVHPLWGALILLAVLYGMYQFVGFLGAQVMVDWLEETLFGGIINPALTGFLQQHVPIPFLRDLFVGQYGIVTMALTYSVAIILPIVTTFFLAFGFLEDSGYFARLAVMSHRAFRKMGLSGQAVLPMILGLGCDTMATVTTRTLDSPKERIIATLLLALGVPCSAQMAVLLAMTAAVSPWVLGGVLAIVGLQVLIVGRLAAHLLPGESTPFVIELPPLRWPQWKNIMAKTSMRLLWYVTEVVPLFVLGTLALFVLDKTAILAAFQALIRPVVEGWLGLPGQAAQAFIMGFFRRDYGAAGLFQLQQAGALELIQVLVSMVVITLFVPCIANLLVIIRERGWRTALAIVAFILPYAILVGTAVNALAQALAGGGG